MQRWTTARPRTSFLPWLTSAFILWDPGARGQGSPRKSDVMFALSSPSRYNPACHEDPVFNRPAFGSAGICSDAADHHQLPGQGSGELADLPGEGRRLLPEVRLGRETG